MNGGIQSAEYPSLLTGLYPLHILGHNWIATIEGHAKAYLNLKETRNLTLQFAEFSHFSAAGVNDIAILNEIDDY